MNQILWVSLSLLIACNAVLGRSVLNTSNIIYYNTDFRPDGYKFSYETSDGMYREEEGYFRNGVTDDISWETKGKISWIDADGNRQTQKFVANEKGYQVENTSVGTVKEIELPPSVQMLSGPIMSSRGGLVGKR